MQAMSVVILLFGGDMYCVLHDRKKHRNVKHFYKKHTKCLN